MTQPAAVIDSFTVSDSTPDADENFTLSWTTTGATRVRLQHDGGIFTGVFIDLGSDRAADGSYTTSHGAGTDRNYRIQAYNSDDETTTSSVINIDIPS